MIVDDLDDDDFETGTEVEPFEPESVHPLVRSTLPQRESLSALSAWSVLEALSPRTYANPRDLVEGNGSLVEVSDQNIPWAEPEEPRPDHAVYYRVGLGSIDMRTATKEILDTFGWDEGTVRPQGSHALIGMILLDGRGAPLSSGTSISSFGWALPLVLGGSLSGMVRWGEVESDVITELNKLICHPDPNPEFVGRLRPLTWADIEGAHAFLVEKFKISDGLVDAPGVAFGFEQRIRPGVVPSPYLLNSFLLGSIERAHGLTSAENPPKALGAYMGFYEPIEPINVLDDRAGLRRLLSPAVTPPARWPAAGGHPLATLQQAAVNAALIDEPGTPGIQAVNGPPGTGKTTMIRDVAAGNLIARAERMVAAEDPEDMFPAVKLGNGRTVHAVDPSLRGFEMIVASSNNKAVENVSRELPLLGAVDAQAGVPRYFRTTSDYLAGISLDPKAKPAAAGSGTWGLVSATLGNSGNRSAFMERFWWNEDHGIRTWLRIAKGEPVRIEVKDAKGKKIGERPPHLIKAESIPKGRAQALKQWGEVRARFRLALADIRKDLADLATFETAANSIPHLEAEAAKARADLEASGKAPAPSPLRERFHKARESLSEAEAELARAEAARPRFEKATPEGFHLWEAEVAEAKARVELYAATCGRLGPAVAGEGAVGTPSFLEARAVLDKVERQLADAKAVAGKLAPRLGIPVDDAFFETGHETWNVASPWMDETLQDKRARLFGLAMEVHEAFVLAAARPMLRNLAAYSEATGNNGSSELSKRIGDLWTTLFLVVPVVSTTFASAFRMLDGLPPGSLGWLIVDEAGQATPQAAVGALVACKRALFVGDPLQIEPVSTLPARLVNRIFDHFGIEPSAWGAPTASAQSLADRASPMRATFSTGHDERHVGMPLLVHRRCQEPMFGISNKIAYAGLMVHAAPSGSGRAARQSTWFDVSGPHEGKWCPSEGDFAADILARMATGGRVPDVFFISPFREVAANLRKRLATEAAKFAQDGAAWARDRVGTVHTFQGREATSVVLVLGAGTAAHAGARKWAGRTPNIANVAVTRAKERLYVIGSLDAWGTTGAFEAVADALPGVRVPRPAAVPHTPEEEPSAAGGLRALARMR